MPAMLYVGDICLQQLAQEIQSISLHTCFSVSAVSKSALRGIFFSIFVRNRRNDLLW